MASERYLLNFYIWNREHMLFIEFYETMRVCPWHHLIWPMEKFDFHLSYDNIQTNIFI